MVAQAQLAQPRRVRPGQSVQRRPQGAHYRWIVLSNTTLGMLVAMVNQSILLISLPAIFRGIGINPLAPGESGYLLWILLGYMVVTATLLVTFGRISDMVGRVKLYNVGFAVFTLGSLLLVWTPGHGNQAALELLLFRLVQGVGGAFLLANSTALLTDAFPAEQRGLAMGINQIAGIAGSLGGLLVGGFLATIDWRLVFLVSVPFGLFGTVWAYLKLHETATIRAGQRLDVWGNLTFGVGLTVLLIGLTYGIEPYGASAMGWGNPFVIGCIIAGAALLAAFVWIETRVADPMFRLDLFRLRAFTAGNLSNFLGSLARGGLQFMLIIWLQGIWLPLHGVSYTDTPLWAGIYTMPMMAGFMLTGPLSGWLSDRFGGRAFMVGGMAVTAVGFVLLTLLPGEFNQWLFFALLVMMGIGMGLFAAPNTTSIMNAVPAQARGVASGMRGTFQNAGQMVSMAFFFSILTTGLAASLPGVMLRGLVQHGLPARLAAGIAHLPPIGVLFAAFLGYNPMRSLVPAPVAAHLGARAQAALFGTTFFPHLILPAFLDGLHLAFYVSAGLALVASLSSLLCTSPAVAARVSVSAAGRAAAGGRHPRPAERSAALLGLTLAVVAQRAQAVDAVDASPRLLGALSALANARFPHEWSDAQRGRAVAREMIQPLAVALLETAVAQGRQGRAGEITSSVSTSMGQRAAHHLEGSPR